jgi:hypothetical protein
VIHKTSRRGACFPGSAGGQVPWSRRPWVRFSRWVSVINLLDLDHPGPALCGLTAIPVRVQRKMAQIQKSYSLSLSTNVHTHANITILGKNDIITITSLTVYSSLSDSDVPPTIRCNHTSVRLTLVCFLWLNVFQMAPYSLCIVHTTLWDLVNSIELHIMVAFWT